MIPRAFRLPIGQNALQNGEAAQTCASPFLLVKYVPNTKPNHRFGVIISAKTGKTAVLRHRMKRIILTSLMAWPPKRAGICYDFLVIVSPRLNSLPPLEMRTALQEVCTNTKQRIFTS